MSGTKSGIAIDSAIIASAVVVLFLGLAASVFTGWADVFDTSIRDWFHSAASPDRTDAARWVSQFGSTAVVLALCAGFAILLYLSAGRNAAAQLVVVVAVTMLANTGLKYLFQRVRPDAYFGDTLESFSFPSGHSAFSCAFYFGVAAVASAFVTSPIARATIYAGALLIVAAIGASRIYLGVHYPTDVAGGYLVAIFCLALVQSLKLKVDAALGVRNA